MFRGVAGSLVVLAACVSPAAVECPDHTVCSDGHSCVYVAAADRYACATDSERTACKDAGDGTACTADGAAGTCFGGGCVLAVCGDHLVEANEVCDDGNRSSDDGCSKDCLSTETCGNNFLDPGRGEQCDEGDPTLGGDGCSRTCKSEYRLWRDVTPHSADSRHRFGLATDLTRGVLLFGGTTSDFGTGGAITTVVADFSDTWRYDGVTWLQRVPPSPTDRRADMAIANDRHGRILEVGGVNSLGNAQRDMFAWDGLQWQKLTPATQPMPARFGAALACATGPQVECVLFGGGAGQASDDDTWWWNGTTWTSQLANATRPPARRHAQLVYDPTQSRYLMFGGDQAGMQLQDTWQYTLATNTWTELSGGTNVNGPQPGATTPAMAFDEVADHAVLVAGAQTWTFDAGVWKQVAAAPPGSAPSLAWDPASARVRSISPNANNDQLMLGSWNGTTWQPQSDQQPSAGSRRTPAAYDERRGVTVVVGGHTWEWDGVGWTQNSNGTSNDTDGGGIAYDAACGAVVEFGGGSLAADGLRFNTTSTYPRPDGKLQWAAVAASPAPENRTRPAMTYDAKRDAIVLFGGFVDEGMVPGDTWELTTADCTTWVWTQKTGAQPPGRYGATLVYDPARDQSVLFGGQDANGTALGDTWAWNGTTWTQLAPTASPSPRVDHMAAWDPRSRTIVLFGGRADTQRYNDTWEWNGRDWARLAPALVPGLRAGAGFALDVTGNLVMINGEGGTGNGVTIVSRLSSELSSEPRETCEVVADADGDGLAGCADPDCWTRCTPLCAPGDPCAGGPRCGDGTCDPVEDYVQCPADCQAPQP